MSVSLCMQAFQEMGKREKTFQNFCTKIIYTFCSQRKGKTDKRIARFLWDGTSNAVYRRAGEVVLDSGTHSSLKAQGIRPHTCTAETGTGFLLDSPTENSPEKELVLLIAAHSQHVWPQKDTGTKSCHFQPQKLVFLPAKGWGWQETDRAGRWPAMPYQKG